MVNDKIVWLAVITAMRFLTLLITFTQKLGVIPACHKSG